MSEINDNTMRVQRLIQEQVHAEGRLVILDEEAGELEARAAAVTGQAKALNARIDEIGRELTPALLAVGPVTWRHDHADYVVRLAPGGRVVVEPLNSWGKLAEAMRPRLAAPPMWDDASPIDRIDLDAYESLPFSDVKKCRDYVACNVTVIDQEAG